MLWDDLHMNSFFCNVETILPSREARGPTVLEMVFVRTAKGSGEYVLAGSYLASSVVAISSSSLGATGGSPGSPSPFVTASTLSLSLSSLLDAL